MSEPTKDEIKEWQQCFQTPPALMRWIESDILPRYGRKRFTLDVCAHPWNSRCAEFIGPPGTLPCEGMVAVDGLTSSWETSDAAWCNAGFGKLEPWMVQAKAQRDLGRFSVVLSHVVVGELWVGQVIDEGASESWLLRPRVDFDFDPRYLAHITSLGQEPMGAAFNTMLWVFDPEIEGPCVPHYAPPWPKAPRAKKEKKSKGKGKAA